MDIVTIDGTVIHAYWICDCGNDNNNNNNNNNDNYNNTTLTVTQTGNLIKPDPLDRVSKKQSQ